MPTYVYKFVDTGETIEIQQSFRDDTLTEAVHPESGKTLPVKKVFLPVGVTFKGDGFYKTDSRNGKSSKSESKSTSTSTDAKSESGSSASTSSSASTGSSSNSTSNGSSSTSATSGASSSSGSSASD